MLNFYAYLRVSTDVQGDQYSLESQSQTAKKLYLEMFPDYGYVEVRDEESGRNDRKNLICLMQVIKEGDVLFVYDNTRLSRDEDIAYSIRVHAQKKKFRYFEGSREYDFSNRMDKLVFSILTIMSQFDSELKSEKVKLNMRLQKEKGEFISGPTYGYDYFDKKVSINQGEAEVVRRMFYLYQDKHSIAKVANIIRSEGFRGKKGATNLSATMVTQALKNPVYIGHQFRENSKKSKRAGAYVDRSMLVRSAHYEPIVSDEVWWNVQSIYHKSAPLHREPMATRHSKYPYSSLFLCYRCFKKGNNSSYWRISEMGGNKTPCYGTNNHIPGCGTRPRNIREDRFVWILETVIRLALKRRDVIERFISKVESLPGTDSEKDLRRKDELGKIQRQIEKQTQKLVIADELGVVRALNEDIKTLRTRESQLKGHIERDAAKVQQDRFAKLKRIGRYRHESIAAIFDSSVESRRSAIMEIITKAYVFNSQLVIQFEFGLTHIVTVPSNAGPKLPENYPLVEFVPGEPSSKARHLLLNWPSHSIYSISEDDERNYEELLRDGMDLKRTPIPHRRGLYFPVFSDDATHGQEGH